MDLAADKVGVEFDLSLDSSRDNLDEHSQVVAVLGKDVDREVDQSPSLPDVLLDLVSGQLELVEGGEAVGSLDVLNVELDLLGEVPYVLLSVLDVSEADLQYPSLEEVVDFLGSCGLLDAGPADLLDWAAGLGGEDFEPFLLEERVVLRLLFLGCVFADLLVLSLGHFSWFIKLFP